MTVLKQANLALSFGLEILVAVTVGYWGYHLASGPYLKIVLAVTVPLLLAVFWGVFLAPMARRRLRMPWLFIVKTMIFAGSALAAYVAGARAFAVILAALIAVNTALVALWAQY